MMKDEDEIILEIMKMDEQMHVYNQLLEQTWALTLYKFINYFLFASSSTASKQASERQALHN